MHTTQISVRLPDSVVAYLNEQVKSGKGRSRASIIAAWAEEARRREIRARDIEIHLKMKNEPDPDELDRLAEWGARHFVGDDQ
jgi:Arc/MetJ-type ribon-helix-helix transcriptional regulator